MVKLNEYNLAIVGTYIYIINLPTLSLTNIIYTYYSNFLICDYKLKYNKNIYFIISQSLANNIDEEQDKGTLGLYKYTINDELLSEQNELDKIISQENVILNLLLVFCKLMKIILLQDVVMELLKYGKLNYKLISININKI